jgi:sulfur carrier protein
VILVNGETMDVSGVTIASLLATLEIETRGVAVARNGEIVRRGEWADVTLVVGDRIEIVAAAAGG